MQTEDGDDPTLPPDTAHTGSIGSQTAPSTAEVRATIAVVPVGSTGLRTVTTTEQLQELARSSEPAEVKRDMFGAMLVGAYQANEAELRLRLQQSDKELGKVRRQLKQTEEQAADLRGDVRVRDEQIKGLKSHRSRDAFLAFLASGLFGVGGAFVGRSLPAAIIGFASGLLLFVLMWMNGPNKTEAPK